MKKNQNVFTGNGNKNEVARHPNRITPYSVLLSDKEVWL